MKLYKVRLSWCGGSLSVLVEGATVVHGTVGIGCHKGDSVME